MREWLFRTSIAVLAVAAWAFVIVPLSRLCLSRWHGELTRNNRPPKSHYDIGGNPDGPIMGISEVKTTETPDPEAETNVALQIGIKKEPGAAIDDNKVKTSIFLYDIVNGKDIKLTDANVSNEWLRPKHDWSDENPEVLLVRYARAKGSGISRQRKYLGYVVRVYYDDQLQADQAEPARLLQQFPESLPLQSPSPSANAAATMSEAKSTPEPTEDPEAMHVESSPDNALFAVTRLVPDPVYIQRHDLDGVAVAIFRGNFQSATVVARHDFRGRLISHIEWSPDSKFLLLTTLSSEGHQPWHTAAFVFCAADKSFRGVDASIGSVTSGEFRFEPPDVAIMEVKKGDMLEEEVKVSLAKTVHQMPRVK